MFRVTPPGATAVLDCRGDRLLWLVPPVVPSPMLARTPPRRGTHPTGCTRPSSYRGQAQLSSAAGSSPRYRHPPSAIRHPPAPVLPSPPPGIRGMMLEFPQPDRPDLSPIPTGASYWPQAYPLPSGYGAVPSGQQLDWEWSRCHVNSSIYSTHTPTAPGLAHRACILRDVGSVCWGCCHRQDPIELTGRVH